MHWKATSFVPQVISPKTRIAVASGIVLLAAGRCLMAFWEKGFSAAFYLYGGLALVATLLEWKHYRKPREVSLVLEDGRLVFTNHYSGERHTVYQSRVQWIKAEQDALIFYGESSIATQIPIRYFSQEQVQELMQRVKEWNKKIAGYGDSRHHL